MIGPVTGFVAFALIWWMVFFTVLPFGVRGQWEGDEIAEGTEPGAPQQVNMKRKLMITTLITAPLWALFAILMISGVLSIENLPAPFEIPEL